MKCPECKAEASEEDNYCNECGSLLKEEEENLPMFDSSVKEEEEDSLGKKILFWIGIILSSFIVLVLFIA